MSSEPPSDTHPEQGEVVDDGDRDPADEPAGDGRRVRWVAIVVTVAVLAVAVGAGLYLFRAQTPGRASEPSPPVHGVACPHVLQAADAYERGDLATYRQEIGLAANAAEDALQTSGEVFGEPERIALELGLSDRPDMHKLLGKASVVCSGLNDSSEAP
jgi:hypothetical protein